jgi:hypothetical protein
LAGILARAKMAPLHLEVHTNFIKWSKWQFGVIERQLESHISHTRHLSISGRVQCALKGLVSSAPILEFLFLSAFPDAVIPVDLFNCTAPNLTSIKLEGCNISRKSPLLKSLRTLEILSPLRPELEVWLDALNEMPRLETLILRSATPLAPLAAPLISEPSRAVTLPSLTNFHISASANDCALALVHFVLPALTRLHVDAASHDGAGEDVLQLIPHVARSVYGLQSTEPYQSILINSEGTRAEVIASTMPDVKIIDPNTLFRASVPACLMFVATDYGWNDGVDTTIVDDLLTHLRLNHISTFTAQNDTWLSKEVWLGHAPRLPLLERVCLAPTAIKAFMAMLAEESPPDGPRLPSLTKLILVDVTLTADRAHLLRDILMEREKQGGPLEVLDLRTCVAADCEIQLLREIIDVQEPEDEDEDEAGYDDRLVGNDDDHNRQ